MEAKHARSVGLAVLSLGLALAIGTFGFPASRGEIDWNAWLAQREIDYLVVKVEVLQRQIENGRPLPPRPADDPPIRIKIREIERKLEALRQTRTELRARMRGHPVPAL